MCLDILEGLAARSEVSSRELVRAITVCAANGSAVRAKLVLDILKKAEPVTESEKADIAAAARLGVFKQENMGFVAEADEYREILKTLESDVS